MSYKCAGAAARVVAGIWMSSMGQLEDKSGVLRGCSHDEQPRLIRAEREN